LSLPLFLCPFFRAPLFLLALVPLLLLLPIAAAGARKEGLPPPLLLAFFFSLSVCLIASSPFLREAAASKRERESGQEGARAFFLPGVFLQARSRDPTFFLKNFFD